MEGNQLGINPFAGTWCEELIDKKSFNLYHVKKWIYTEETAWKEL
jgi:hypothetical protein